ncbi:MAG: FAD-binding protein [Firmicutes bacterium]|jgi:glycolate oxidase|nr:FAD-binding protein [Bacillota bacterium]HOB21858.1 FAD-linked oxidase C-terminal domain-containing protein [Bacillota bacterium]HQD39525.1 FAD-linked oxidase C-terminal domain-containing protein [Bacillota bacterium]
MKLTDSDIAALQEIVGKENVILDNEALEDYCHDEIPSLYFQPDAVVKPENTEQVSKIMALASERKFPVTPRGAGSGLSGGAVAVEGGIVLSLEKFNRILEIDQENMMAVVEPGVLTGQLQKEVEAVGLFYPVDPASLDSCSIGGNFAANAGGPQAVKYGITRHYVTGIEAVLPSGEIINYGGKLVKNTSGYDLLHILLGSEGTLAIVTKLVLKLIPLPKYRIDLLVPFSSFEAAADTVTKIFQSRITPVVLEFMDKAGVKSCEAFLGKELPFSDAEAQLIVGLDGNNEELLEQECEIVGEICLEAGADDVLVADTPFAKENLWEARRELLETLKAISEEVEVEDVVVPRAKIPEMIRATVEISKETGFPIVNWGHAGDGNVHVAILKKDISDEKWQTELEGVIERVFQKAIELGGTITGEHGIGYLKRKHLPMAVGQVELELMKKIKAAFDPEGILNPGKLF